MKPTRSAIFAAWLAFGCGSAQPGCADRSPDLADTGAAVGDGDPLDAGGRSPDAGDVADTSVPPGPPELVLGRLIDGRVIPFAAGEEVEIVQGPQGGLHLATAVEAAYPAGAAKARVRLLSRALQDGQLVGAIDIASYALVALEAEPDTFQSHGFYVFLASSDATLYADRAATLDARLTMPDGSVREASVEVVLVDHE